MPPYNEKDLLIKLRDGDYVAFETLYHTYSKRIYWKFRRMIKIDEEVEELFQELFVRIWERREKVDVNQPFSAYLYRIAENMVYDFYRKAARDQKLHDAILSISNEAYEHIEESIFKDETNDLIDRAIATLPPQRRQAFILCKLEEKSYEEAATIMGISPNTIHNHIVKATQSLKVYFGRQGNHVPPMLLLLALSPMP
ncbi:RNA polymerase sigma-70 factor [Sphingobacterium alkalisoli]|uniref:RNA polymerase sigma-70 factor n=1 Tax=Sphingobacterium alkalisoli TaxID=1874115 RepID=A0A4U0GX31_9SPHI|nr:RNA polymerase sigma-70 factor [Sphingobacterium alkalisoli]TJY63720.1 RNA polymerase sigma-70 factor [Sphingobacterium alkalisoli]GGH25306.1 RNA polymerase sigma factor [Sphingobacterium alkalisoli]